MVSSKIPSGSFSVDLSCLRSVLHRKNVKSHHWLLLHHNGIRKHTMLSEKRTKDSCGVSVVLDDVNSHYLVAIIKMNIWLFFLTVG